MISHLSPAGEVELGAALEEVYRHPAAHHLRVNFVASLDGVIEIEGRSGPLGAPADRSAFMAMRAVADVVLVGAGTARAENYGPVRLEPAVEARRIERNQPPRPRLAVVTNRGDLMPAARMFEGEDPVTVFTNDQAIEAHADLGEVAEMVGCGAGHVDLARAISVLQDRGEGRIVCEGGPALARSLFQAGLVDELCLSLAPVLAGVGHRSLQAAWEGAPGRFAMTGLLEGDGLLLTRYARVAT
jgi:riboflavin biosynthesis pyrimidine reductase